MDYDDNSAYGEKWTHLESRMGGGSTIYQKGGGEIKNHLLAVLSLKGLLGILMKGGGHFWRESWNSLMQR